MQPQSWVYIFKDSGAGGDGRLRINLRKVKDLVNNASILAIFSLKLYNFWQNFLKNKMELLQSQAPVDRELSGSSASARHGTFDIRH